MKKLIVLLLLINVSLNALPNEVMENRKIKGIAELVAGLAVIGFSIYQMGGCKKDIDPVTEHPIKTVLFNRHAIMKSLKECGLRISLSAGAMVGLGLPLCYLGLFELLHKPKVKNSVQ